MAEETDYLKSNTVVSRRRISKSGARTNSKGKIIYSIEEAQCSRKRKRETCQEDEADNRFAKTYIRKKKKGGSCTQSRKMLGREISIHRPKFLSLGTTSLSLANLPSLLSDFLKSISITFYSSSLLSFQSADAAIQGGGTFHPFFAAQRFFKKAKYGGVSDGSELLRGAVLPPFRES